ncbi:MFS transporter [Ramlibacter humi]|uniref:MFS transporter n=1 Tax=Ramlibacter humi TaxID=2530451 RepID=A0A4Z0BCE3_9BURK|nr:MFS transporter [Ramlibacter humi]TFY96321.1 MFS transporter [Ramlibacter humi]
MPVLPGKLAGQVNAPAPPSANTFSVLLVTLSIQALVSMGVLAVPAMGPAMAQAMGVSPALLGAYIGLVYVGAMVASLMSAPLVLRYGALRTSQLALLGCAVGLALPALWPSLPAAVIGALLTGLGYGPVTPASSHLLARSTPPERASLVFSVKQTGVPLGGVMAGAIVPPIVQAAGAQVALLSVVAACIVCMFAAQPFRAALDEDRDPARPLRMGSFMGGLKLVGSEPALKQLATMSFVFSIAQMCLSTYLVTYLHGSLGYTLVAAGGLLSASQAGGVVGRIAWGWMADRWLDPYRMLAILAAAMAVCAGGAALMQADTPATLVLVLLVAFGASAIGWNGVYLAEVARRSPPGMAGVATSGTLAFTFFGVVVGPPLFGALSNVAGSYRAGYAAVAVPTAVCALVLWRLGRRAR